MKRLLTCLLLICIGIIYFQCSSPEECVQIDWIGTYTLSTDKECTLDQTVQGTLEFNDVIVIEAGSSQNHILWDGVEVEIFECDAEKGNESLYINGNNLDLRNGQCSATYQRN